MEDSGHIPVLRGEVVDLLAVRPGSVYADATAGRGGHAAALADLLGADGTVVLNDLDPANLAFAADRVRALPEDRRPRVVEVRGSFDDLPERLGALGLRVDALLADFGFASNQVGDPGRGLSFRNEGPLDMRLDPDGDLTAEVLVNELPESELAEIFWRYGEERYSRRIAQNLAHVRRDRPITTTVELAEIVRAAQPAAARRGGTIDPATRVFQALRIAVNDEIGRIERLLARVDAAASGRADWLAEGARVAFISFHSLEDRLVKQSVRGWSERGWAEALTRKPATASEAETLANPRARSAKLRAARLIGRTDPG